MKSLLRVLLVILAFSNISFSQFEWDHTSGPLGSLFSSIYSNEKYAFVPTSDFLFRAADGIEWEKLDHKVTYLMCTYHDTLLSVLNNGVLNAMTLKLSYDNGQTWISKLLPAEITNADDIVMTSHGIYIAQGISDQIFQSIDLGETWDPIDIPIQFYEMTVFDNRIYIKSSSHVIRSDSNGENWEEITPPIHPQEYIDDLTAKDSHLIFSSERGIYTSHDHGLNWNKYQTNAGNGNDVLTLVGNDVYAQVVYDLLRSSDFGENWDTISSSDLVLDLLNHTGFKNMLLSTTSNKGVFKWDDEKEALVENNTGLSKGYIYDLSYGAGKIWAACGNGVFAYDVSSATWSNKFNLPLPEHEYEYITANDHGWVITSVFGRSYFYFSEDYGSTWDTIRTSSNQFHSIDRIQLVEDYLFLFADHSVFRSINKGISWEYLPMEYQDRRIVPFQNKQYLADFDKLYFTIDNGLTWHTSFPTINIKSLYSSGDLLYAVSDSAGNSALYYSDDALLWNYSADNFPEEYNPSYPYKPSSAFFFRDEHNHYAFLGWHGHYVWPAGETTWSKINQAPTGNHYLINDNTIYMGGGGMYKSALENPFITEVDEINDFTEDIFSIS